MWLMLDTNVQALNFALLTQRISICWFLHGKYVVPQKTVRGLKAAQTAGQAAGRHRAQHLGSWEPSGSNLCLLCDPA
jgi:hypothetical protein